MGNISYITSTSESHNSTISSGEGWSLKPIVGRAKQKEMAYGLMLQGSGVKKNNVQIPKCWANHGPLGLAVAPPAIRARSKPNRSCTTNYTITWSRQVLTEQFIAPDIDIILKIPLSSRLQNGFRVWHYDRRGIFSVRSAYRMSSETKAQREDWLEHRPSNSNQAAAKRDWTNLWKVNVRSKVHVFVWRLAHTSLPTGTTRYKRNMTTSPVCSICSAVEDTWRHSLFECRMARYVWALGDEEILEHAISNQAKDARLWLFWLFDSMTQHYLACVLITMWTIWWARRRAIHDDVFRSPLTTMSFITRYS